MQALACENIAAKSFILAEQIEVVRAHYLT
jgi:hypothetical protein